MEKNELEQIKEDLRKALERVEELEKQQPKEVTLDEILENASGRYRFNINRTVDGDYGNYWTNHKDKFEAEHEMWRLILKRVAQYLNYEKINIGRTQHVYYLTYSEDKDILSVEPELNEWKSGQQYFIAEKLAEQAIEIIGEDNIKRALSEEYCRNNPKTE